MKNFTSNKFYALVLSTSGFLVVLFIWGIFARNTNSLILPAPRETLLALKKLLYTGELYHNLLITVKRTMLGYGFALITGILLSLLLHKNKILQLILRPLITVIQTTPPVIWIVLAVIWFGIAEDLTPVFLIFTVTFPIIFINLFEGLQDISKELIEMAEVYSWNKKQVYLHIYYPALIPHLVSAVSIGFAFAWKSSVFAEFVGSASGVGFALSMANSNLQTAKLFAWAIVLVVLMLIIEYIIIKPVQKTVTRWRKDEQST